MNRLLFSVYRIIVPKPLRTKILKKNLRRKILSYFAEIPGDKINEDQKEVLNYLKNNPVSIFPYPFQDLYLPVNVEVYSDPETGMKYVNQDGKRLYFKKRWNKKRIQKGYSELAKEQDYGSPHRYISNDFSPGSNDVLADIGTAEGNFSLSVIELPRAGHLSPLRGDRPGGRGARLRLAGVAHRLPGEAVRDHARRLDRRRPLAPAGRAQGGPLRALLHQRGLRRSAGAPAARELLGATSTPSARARSTTRPSASPRPSPWPTGATRRWRPASPASSTPTGHACGSTTAGWCRRWWGRRCAASRSPCSATARRPAPSATSPTTSRGSGACSARRTPEPVNIGNPVEMTILAFAEAVQRHVGSALRHRLQAAAAGRSTRAPPRHQPGARGARAGSRPSTSRRGCASPSPGSGSGSRGGAEQAGVRARTGPSRGAARAPEESVAKKILITGGAGFIGSTIADAFVGAGWDVAVVDDLSSGKRENVPAAARFYPCDVRSAAAAEAVEKERPDVLCHHAAQIDVRRSMVDPRFDADVNLGGLLNLMQAAVRAGSVKQVLFASSGGATYGDTAVIPTPETHPQLPVSHYGAAKAASELYLGVFKANYGIPYAALRYANVYGPRQDPHGEAGVVAIFCGRLLDGKPCTIYGDGAPDPRLRLRGRRGSRQPAGGAARRSRGAQHRDRRRDRRQPALRRAGPQPAGSSSRRSMPRRGSASSAGPASIPTAAGRSLGWKAEVAIEQGLARTFQYFKAKRG